MTPKLGNPYKQLWSFIGSRECWRGRDPKFGNTYERPLFGSRPTQFGGRDPKVGESPWTTLIFHWIERMLRGRDPKVGVVTQSWGITMSNLDLSSNRENILGGRDPRVGVMTPRSGIPWVSLDWENGKVSFSSVDLDRVPLDANGLNAILLWVLTLSKKKKIAVLTFGLRLYEKETYLIRFFFKWLYCLYMDRISFYWITCHLNNFMDVNRFFYGARDVGPWSRWIR